MAKQTVETLRSSLAKCQEEQDAAHRKYKEAEKRTRAAGRDLITALAEGIDLTPAERRAMGLRRAK